MVETQMNNLAKTPFDIWQRCMAMVACIYRVNLEDEPVEFGTAELAALKGWLAEMSLNLALTPLEMEIVNAEIGTLTNELKLKGGWNEEGALVLGWAIGALDELPPYAEQGILGEEDIFEALGFLATSPNTDTFQLRVGVDWLDCERFYGAMVRELRRIKNGVPSINFAASQVSKSVNALLKFEIIGQDIAVGEHRIIDLPNSQVALLHSIAIERYRAFAWLVGDLDEYDASTLEVVV